MYFYELHEGDDQYFSDVLLARENEMEADVFFDIVQTIRRRVQDSFEHDTLIEAIAGELEAEYDFIFIGDDRLTAAVNVSQIEGENFLADLSAEDGEARSTGDGGEDGEDADEGDADEGDEGDADEGDEDEDEELGDASNGAFRTLRVEIDRDADAQTH